MREGNVEVSKRVIAVMPERPARIVSQASERPMPTGDTMPIPVTATRRLGIVSRVWANREAHLNLRRELWQRKPGSGPANGLLLQMRIDVIDGLLDGRDLLRPFVGNLRFELLFQRHHQLDGIQRVSPEIVDERGFVLDLGLVHSQLLGDDLL